MIEFLYLFCIFLANCCRAHVITDTSVKTVKCERYKDLSYSAPNEREPNFDAFDYDPDVDICSTNDEGDPFCFTLWSNDSKGVVEVVGKGCFQSHDDCGPSCVSHKTTKKLHYCCCEGDFCNKEFFYEPLWTYDEGDSQLYDLPTIPIVLIVIFFIALCLAVVGYVLRRRPYACITDKHRRVQVSRDPSNEEVFLRPIELLEVKAEGRFGVVWKAKYKNDFVAVKSLQVDYYQLWSNEMEVFKLPKMSHENIVQFIGGENRCLKNPKAFWIITAYQELGSLHDYLKFNTVTWEQLCVISYTMTRGLAHLHEEIPCEKSDVFKPSIAHRDFKSANVLLKSDLTACIADFGFAYVFRSAVCESHHERIGTKRYMAPEVLEGIVGFSNHAFLCMDMYACALVLWEILSRCSVHEDAKNKYRLPYEAELGENISIEELQDFVVCKKGRPTMKEAWKNNSELLSSVSEIIEDCWDHDGEARLSAACVTERFSWFLRSAVSSDTKLIV